jgi:hypothetical protein
MHDSNQQEFFSHVYVSAIISAAGFNILTPRIDRKKLDFAIQGDYEPCKINIQLKSTTSAKFSKGNLKFRLDGATYNILRQPSTTLFLLLVVVMPRDIQRWAVMTPNSLELRHYAYWCRLEGSPPISTESVTLTIAKEQRFTIEFLRETMQSLRAEGGAS